MWCIGRLTEEYRSRMYGLLDLYALPYLEREPVVCIDEKSKQLLKGPGNDHARSCCLAAAMQRRALWYRVELHSPRC